MGRQSYRSLQTLPLNRFLRAQAVVIDTLVDTSITLPSTGDYLDESHSKWVSDMLSGAPSKEKEVFIDTFAWHHAAFAWLRNALPHLSLAEAKDRFSDSTMVGSDGARSGTTLKQHQAAFLRCQKPYLDWHSGTALDTAIGDLEAMGKASPYIRGLSIQAVGTRLGYTDDDRFDLVPAAATTGGFTRILLGIPAPYVIRHQGDHYMLVGECSFHDALNREALQWDCWSHWELLLG